MNVEVIQIQKRLELLQETVFEKLNCNLEVAPAPSDTFEKYIEWLPDITEFQDDIRQTSLLPNIRFNYILKARTNKHNIFTALDDLVSLRKMLNAQDFTVIAISSIAATVTGQDARLQFNVIVRP